MPKTGPSRFEWEERFIGIAEGTYKIGPGQMPPKGSANFVRIQKIIRCPLQTTSKYGRNVLGEKAQCMCTYHNRRKKPCTGLPKDTVGLPATAPPILGAEQQRPAANEHYHQQRGNERYHQQPANDHQQRGNERYHQQPANDHQQPANEHQQRNKRPAMNPLAANQPHKAPRLESTSTIVRPPTSGQATPTPQVESRRTESSRPALNLSRFPREIRDSVKQLKLSAHRDRMSASSVQPRIPQPPLIPTRPRSPARPVHCGIKEKETSRDVTVPAFVDSVTNPVSEDAMPSSMLSNEPLPESDLVPEETRKKRPPMFPRQPTSYAHRL